jgi:tRNA(fMet)-specific endonuclease VapC
VIALLQGEDLSSKLDETSEVFLSAIVVGELFFGAANSGRPEENMSKLEGFVAGRSILPCNLVVAREYGRLPRRLRGIGRPLPENDVWIAAAAVCNQLTLVTRDQHFRDLDELSTAFW